MWQPVKEVYSAARLEVAAATLTLRVDLESWVTQMDAALSQAAEFGPQDYDPPKYTHNDNTTAEIKTQSDHSNVSLLSKLENVLIALRNDNEVS